MDTAGNSGPSSSKIFSCAAHDAQSALRSTDQSVYGSRTPIKALHILHQRTMVHPVKRGHRADNRSLHYELLLRYWAFSCFWHQGFYLALSRPDRQPFTLHPSEEHGFGLATDELGRVR